MYIVTENSEADLVRRQAMDQVASRLRELTANLLRVTRGAGKPYEIGGQAQELVNALVEYCEEVGDYPSNEELSGAVDVSPEETFRGQISNEEIDRMYAKHQIVCGALQITASRILGQRTQETAGGEEMTEGIRSLREIAAKQSNRERHSVE